MKKLFCNFIINSLDNKEEEVFILSQYENMKYKDIAKVLKVSTRTVRRRMKSAVIKVIAELERLKFVVRQHYNFKK